MSKIRALLGLKRKDEETGLHYSRHRYYSPYVGRFISKDPIGLLGGFNIYKYASNPISWIDPYGLKSLYRSMSIEEYNSIKRTGKWTTKPGALDGKWLAESYATAKIWGNTMGHGGCEFMIVQVNM
jgi:RHS repeat-associated protein